MRLYKTDAIILKKMNYLESDRIVSMLSVDRGKIRVIAKGARKIKNRFSGSLETGNAVRATIYQKKEGSGLALLSACDIKESWLELRKDFEFTETFFYMLAVAEELTPEGEFCADVYNLLFNVLKNYKKDKKIFNIITFFDINVSRLMGFVPVFTKCAVCGGEISGKRISYSRRCGGVVCDNCSGKHSLSGHISFDALKAMSVIGRDGMNGGGYLELSKELKEDIENFLYPFIVYHSGREVKARGILKQMHLI